MAYIKLQLYIVLLQLFIFVNSEGRNSIPTLCRFTIYTLYKFSSNIFLVPTTGCDVISSGGMCYSYFTGTGRNWADSRQQCLARGSDLAIITSSEENTLLASLITQSTCWIGFNDINSEGTFTWADGSQVTYTGWSSGNPMMLEAMKTVQNLLSIVFGMIMLVHMEFHATSAVLLVRFYLYYIRCN